MKFIVWRACERLGIDPRSVDLAEPGFVRDLIGYEMVREGMEIRERRE